MKLATLACLFVAATFAYAQNSSKSVLPGEITVQPSVQMSPGCPVVFTNVALNTKGHSMLVHEQASPDGDVTFQYKNQSGKDIQSISVRVELKVKKSVYDLDATPVTLDMMLSGKNMEEALPLAAHPYGLGRVMLEQVAYTDGTAWNASSKNTCNYNRMNGAEEIGKLQ